MSSWLRHVWDDLNSLLESFDPKSVVTFIGGRLLQGLIQAITVVGIGWFVLYRHWRQINQGKSDQIVFSANLFTRLDPTAEHSANNGRYLLQIRTVLPPKTINELLDNTALRRQIRHLAEQATITDPILATEGTAGFEIVNHIVNCVSGHLAISSFRRDQWLMAVTCEDRRVVRKCCIRVLLVRRADLEQMVSWDWCRDHVLVEAWYHYWRVVTLHQIARRFQEEQATQREGTATDIQGHLLPLVDRQAHHPRIRILSLGLNAEEPIVKSPVPIDWERFLPQVADLGLILPGNSTPEPLH
jgi:hypothetical protein